MSRIARTDLQKAGLFLLLVAGLVVAPFVFYPVFLMKALCLALFACAFNLFLGYTGLLSFGHAAFFGSAAYLTAHAVKVLGTGPLVGVVLGAVLAGALGLLFGWLAIRRQGIYFAMVTLAFAQMVYFLALQLPFTGGEDGIQSIPRRALFGVIDMTGSLPMYFFVLVVFLLAFLFIYRVLHSPFGAVLKAIRENEPRAISLGYDVDRYKLLAFVLSATLSGVAGGLKALVFRLTTLSEVHWHTSGDVVLMTLLGGMGTVFGPVVGAFLLVALQQYLATVGSWVTVITGATFVVVVLLFRRGIVGEIEARVFRSRKPTTEGAVDKTPVAAPGSG